MTQLGFYYDMTTCIGCKTCQIACKDKNDLKVGALFRRVETFEGGKFPQPWVFHLSTSCYHCQNPKCMEVCPTAAISKREDGIVLVNADRCIGCRYCTWACPYGALQFLEEKGVIGKCDFCVDLIDKGENPACVDACVMRCLHFGDLEELKAQLEELKAQYEGDMNLNVLPDSNITIPSGLITPKPEAKR
jgi:anaerobic dimethyl sulfoxide reductase subunit B (iron-sulfur subunit)